MQLFYLCPRITKKMAKSCKDAIKLMSPQCVLHKFLLLQDVAARCPFNLTPGPRLHNADVVLENVTLTFDSKNTPIMFLKNGSRYGLWALELRAECEENRKSLIISIPSPSRVTPIFGGAVTGWKIAYATSTSTPLSVESPLKVTKIKVCWIASNVPIRKIHSGYDFQVLAHPQKLALCELLLKM